MATYASLSQAEKDLVAAWERNFRGWINTTIARGVSQARALEAHYEASGGPGEILATLDPGEIVPNTSGLAGAQNLTIEEVNALVNAFNTFLNSYDTDMVRRNAAKAAGPTAGL